MLTFLLSIGKRKLLRQAKLCLGFHRHARSKHLGVDTHYFKIEENHCKVMANGGITGNMVGQLGPGTPLPFRKRRSENGVQPRLLPQ